MKLRSIILCLFIGILVGIIGVIVYNTAKTTNEIVKKKVVVDRTWLESKIFPKAIKTVNNKTVSQLETYLFGMIDNIYINNSQKILGFDFHDDSYQGYAYINYKSDTINGYAIYSIYDTKLYDLFVPTGKILYFKYKQNTYIFDDVKKRLYLINKSSCVELLHE